MRFNETSIARMRDAWDDRKRRLMDEFGVDGGAGGAGTDEVSGRRRERAPHVCVLCVISSFRAPVCE